MSSLCQKGSNISREVLPILVYQHCHDRKEFLLANSDVYLLLFSEELRTPRLPAPGRSSFAGGDPQCAEIRAGNCKGSGLRGGGQRAVDPGWSSFLASGLPSFPRFQEWGCNKAGEPGQTSRGDPARFPLSLISPQSYLDIADAAQVMLEWTEAQGRDVLKKGKKWILSY